MDLALHFPCVYPMSKQGFRRAKSANLFMSEIADSLSPASFNGVRRIRPRQKAYSSSSMGRSKKGSVCCKKQADKRTSNPSKSNQEEIISLFRQIQSSISKGESPEGHEGKNRDGSPENVPLSKAILAILEKPRKQSEGDSGEKGILKRQQVKVAQPPSSFAKKSPTRPSDSVPRGKFPVSKSVIASEEMKEKEEKAPLIIETMKLAELKEVAKNRGIKGHSKLKKSELLKLIR